MDSEDLARIEKWAAKHQGRSSGPKVENDATPESVPIVTGFGSAQALSGAVPPANVKFEAGLRVCPACGKPVHLSATTCRECGSPVPRR